MRQRRAYQRRLREDFEQYQRDRQNQLRRDRFIQELERAQQVNRQIDRELRHANQAREVYFGAVQGRNRGLYPRRDPLLHAPIPELEEDEAFVPVEQEEQNMPVGEETLPEIKRRNGRLCLQVDKYRELTLHFETKQNPLGFNCGLTELGTVVSSFGLASSDAIKGLDYRESSRISREPVEAKKIIEAFDRLFDQMVIDITTNIPGVYPKNAKTFVFSDSASKRQGLFVDGIIGTEEDKKAAERVLSFRTRDVYEWAKRKGLGIVSKTRTFTNPNYVGITQNQVCVYTWQPFPPESQPSPHVVMQKDENKTTEGESVSFIEE